MSNIQPLYGLGPGDKFYYEGTDYIVIANRPSEHFKDAVVPNIMYALSLDTYGLVAFNKGTEVEVIYYYGGI
jgi:hypothetical protein